MPNRLLQIFGSYDLFGKSVPGALLLVGLVSLLPQEAIRPIRIEPTFLNIASLFLILLLLGLMIGQGVHTLADNFEKLVLWIVRRLNRTRKVLEVAINANLDPSVLKSKPEGADEEYDPLYKRILRNWRNSTIEWVRCRYWGMYDSLVSHRYLFAKSIEWNFTPESGRWEVGEMGELYGGFVETYKKQYGKDLRREVPTEIIKRYPLITSQLSTRNDAQFRHFQSIYSFCRSMWVVFVLLSAIFSTILFWNPFSPNSPPVLFLIPQPILDVVPLFTLIGAVVFFDAAGDYKRHFVEYLIADFLTESNRERGEGNGNESEQSRLERW